MENDNSDHIYCPISLRIKNEITIIDLFVVQKIWQYYCEIENEIGPYDRHKTS